MATFLNVCTEMKKERQCCARVGNCFSMYNKKKKKLYSMLKHILCDKAFKSMISEKRIVNKNSLCCYQVFYSRQIAAATGEKGINVQIKKL